MATRGVVVTAAAAEMEKMSRVEKVHARKSEIVSAALLTDMVYFMH